MGSKKEQFIFTAIMCALMVFIMSGYNIFLNEGALSGEIIRKALIWYIPTYAMAFFCQWFIVGKPAMACAFRIVGHEDVMVKKILAISFFMVCGMVLCMSLYGTVIHVGISRHMPREYAKCAALNFAAALPSQLFIAGPATRFLHGKVMTAIA
jgi:hypothetical protein